LSRQYDVFIQGSTVDLCVATEEIAYESDWYNWFNDKAITKNLGQGAFPNTRAEQKDFFISETRNGKRLILLIVTKDSELKGVVSLSNIDLINGTAGIALVVDGKIGRIKSRLASLEAISLITQHGFDAMHLNRISGFQNSSLGFWQRHMEVVGYRVEGLHKMQSHKTDKFSNTAVTLACTKDDYRKIIQNRGKLFDDETAMLERINKLPKRSFAADMEEFVLKHSEQYYAEIWKY
jgi:hypothetical protein